MSETLLSIQEAAEISGKSIQTIRRSLKTNKLQHKRKRTPQGFNYLINRDSLVNLFKLQSSIFDRVSGGIKNSENKGVAKEFATVDDLKKFQQHFEQILDENKKEKDNFMRFMKAFQERFVVLENQLKLLEQPKKKWYSFWR